MKLAALGVGVLLAWGVAELGVLLLKGEQAKFPRRVVEAPWGLRYNDPGTSYRHKSADGSFWFEINDQGMRADRNYDYEKPNGVQRIVSLGDSYTIGYEVQGDETFSHVLETILNERDRQVEVLNAGVSGFSNAEEVAYLERELLKYDPDVVLVSFYGNDLVDNMRTGLFVLGDDGKLEEARTRYVPAGGLGNFLNSNWFFNLLSERSNAFVFLKEELTELVKGQMVRANQEAFSRAADEADEEAAPEEAAPGPFEDLIARKKLAAAIFERLYRHLRERAIPLVIHSIPAGLYGPEGGANELFPVDHFDVNRPGIAFVSIIDRANAYTGDVLLVNRHSHLHWSKIPHRWAGEAIAVAIEENDYLE